MQRKHNEISAKYHVPFIQNHLLLHYQLKGHGERSGLVQDEAVSAHHEFGHASTACGEGCQGILYWLHFLWSKQLLGCGGKVKAPHLQMGVYLPQ